MKLSKEILKEHMIDFFISIYVVGFFGHIISFTRSFFLFLTPFALLMTAGVAIFKSLETRKLIIWFSITAVICYILEVYGVKTGKIFGDYSYGKTFGLSLLGVPLIIALNWSVVVWGAIAIIETLLKNKICIIFLAPVLTTLFDYILEPIAIQFGYWKWSGGVIPLQNYIAWYLIALVFTIFYVFLNCKTKNKVPITVFVVQFIYFILLQLALII